MKEQKRKLRTVLVYVQSPLYLKVIVLDRNDNGPQFTLREYRFNAREEADPSSLGSIGRVCIDSHERVHYVNRCV